MTRPHCKPPTEAQNKARARNWRIRNLRSLYAQSHILTGMRRSAVLSLIDEELATIGAEKTSDRVRRLIQEEKA